MPGKAKQKERIRSATTGQFKPASGERSKPTVAERVRFVRERSKGDTPVYVTRDAATGRFIEISRDRKTGFITSRESGKNIDSNTATYSDSLKRLAKR